MNTGLDPIVEEGGACPVSHLNRSGFSSFNISDSDCKQEATVVIFSAREECQHLKRLSLPAPSRPTRAYQDLPISLIVCGKSFKDI